jgi:hypothetical protein
MPEGDATELPSQPFRDDVQRIADAVERERGDGMKLYEASEAYAKDARQQPPFPSCLNSDAKMWQFIVEHAEDAAIFWNVAGTLAVSGSPRLSPAVNRRSRRWEDAISGCSPGRLADSDMRVRDKYILCRRVKCAQEPVVSSHLERDCPARLEPAYRDQALRFE